MENKSIKNELIISLITNVLTSIFFFIIGFLVDTIFSLNISIANLFLIALILSVLVTVIIFVRKYHDISLRLLQLSFLQEDSASKSFDIFIKIIRQAITQHKQGDNNFYTKTLLPLINELIQKRRQPMQIIGADCQKILTIAEEDKSPISITDQMLYYLDFMAAFKKMAMQRIIRQANLYMQTFSQDSVMDYVLVYGHSTVVLRAIISCYRNSPFPIVVIEDLQYHNQSLQEHKVVCSMLQHAGIPYTLIKFINIKELFDLSTTRIIGISGEELPLLRRRRIHAFVGCERIDTLGNTLVPSEIRGMPSETAQFLQEMENYASERNLGNFTSARVVVLSESYKVRDFIFAQDIHTHVPLRGKNIQKILFLIGIRKTMPDLQPVNLFVINSKNIYAHINELGIFPNIDGKFDLRYCKKVFESEANLMLFFPKRNYLNYQIFDEINAVLFDLNGVILEDEDVHYLAFSKILSEVGVEFSKNDYFEYCSGKSDEDGFMEIKNRFLIDMDISSLITKKHQIYLTSLLQANPKLLPSVESLLNELYNHGYKICLVTASSREEVDVVLNYLQIGHYFNLIISDDDVIESKPSPEGYLLAAKKMIVHQTRCLVIEDSSECIKSAKEQGFRTIGIRSNNKSLENADYILSSVDELFIA